MNPTEPAARAVLDFWFGQPPATTPRAEWFRKDDTFDSTVDRLFRADLDAALGPAPGGGLPQWGATAQGQLARIVVVDQFTRNVFRGSARAFAGDALALSVAQALVQSGDDRRLPPLQRWFVYLPFEHAEDAAMQQQSLQLFGALAAQHPALADAQVWAQKHADVIQRFGRYPHRNALLGRASTAAELEFLAQPGSVF